MIDIEHFLDVQFPETMGFCPICDDPIENHQRHAIVTAWGFKTLAHESCAAE